MVEADEEVQSFMAGVQNRRGGKGGKGGKGGRGKPKAAQTVSRAFLASLKKLLDAEVDPSRRAVIDARDALTRAYGVEQMSLVSLHVYTDDPAFQVVGHDNFLMLLEEWFTLVTQIGLRMAIAAKRQGAAARARAWPIAPGRSGRRLSRRPRPWGRFG